MKLNLLLGEYRKHLQIPIAVCYLLIATGCSNLGGSSPQQAAELLDAKGFTVAPQALEKYKRYIVIDPLEGNIYFTADDYNDYLLNSEFSVINFTFFPPDTEIIATFRSKDRSWTFSKYVSVYAGSEKIVDRSKGFARWTDTSVVSEGTSSSVYTHEIYSLRLSLEQARRLANTPKSQITVRFGGGDAGYVDRTLHPLASTKGLNAVTEIASLLLESRATRETTQRSTDLQSNTSKDLSSRNRVNSPERDEKDELTLLASSDFERGETRLLRPTLFRGYGAALDRASNIERLKILYEERLWQRLADSVIDDNFGDNLGYLLLARAAYELGFPTAAVIYANQARTESNRPLTGSCLGPTCMGLDIDAELDRLQRDLAGTPDGSISTR